MGVANSNGGGHEGPEDIDYHGDLAGRPCRNAKEVMGMDASSPTFTVWMNAFCDFVAIVIELWMVMLVLMTVGLFRLVRIGEFKVLAGCMSASTGLVFAFAEHVLRLSSLLLCLGYGSELERGIEDKCWSWYGDKRLDGFSCFSQRAGRQEEDVAMLESCCKERALRNEKVWRKLEGRVLMDVERVKGRQKRVRFCWKLGSRKLHASH